MEKLILVGAVNTKIKPDQIHPFADSLKESPPDIVFSASDGPSALLAQILAQRLLLPFQVVPGFEKQILSNGTRETTSEFRKRLRNSASKLLEGYFDRSVVLVTGYEVMNKLTIPGIILTHTISLG